MQEIKYITVTNDCETGKGVSKKDVQKMNDALKEGYRILYTCNRLCGENDMRLAHVLIRDIPKEKS